MTPILASSSRFLLNLCSYSLTSHSHLSTSSVLCRIDKERFGCNRYCIRTRQRPLSLLSYVAFSPRHASSPQLTLVFFTVTRALPLHKSAKGKAQLRILILENLFHHCCGCDLVFLHRSPTQCFNRLGGSQIPCVP